MTRNLRELRAGGLHDRSRREHLHLVLVEQPGTGCRGIGGPGQPRARRRQCVRPGSAPRPSRSSAQRARSRRCRRGTPKCSRRPWNTWPPGSASAIPSTLAVTTHVLRAPRDRGGPARRRRTTRAGSRPVAPCQRNAGLLRVYLDQLRGGFDRMRQVLAGGVDRHGYARSMRELRQPAVAVGGCTGDQAGREAEQVRVRQRLLHPFLQHKPGVGVDRVRAFVELRQHAMDGCDRRC